MAEFLIVIGVVIGYFLSVVLAYFIIRKIFPERDKYNYHTFKSPYLDKTINDVDIIFFTIGWPITLLVAIEVMLGSKPFKMINQYFDGKEAEREVKRQKCPYCHSKASNYM